MNEPKAEINFFTEGVDFSVLSGTEVKNWLLECVREEGSTIDSINIVFCDDQFLLNLNQQYLSHDYYTDILTFQYKEDPLEGELYISLDRVKENAKARELPFEIELKRVVIHGVLHLIGYRDDTQETKQIIRNKEDQYLARFIDKEAKL